MECIGFRNYERAGTLIASVILCLFIFIGFQGAGQKSFKVVHPYNNLKPYQYKASLHNHTRFHPENTHALDPAGQRLIDYRDYQTDPPYGIVAITDHSRVSTPSSTVPSAGNENSASPWGVEGILWIPGNESTIGTGGVGGDMVIVNVSVEQLDQADWTMKQSNSARSGWIYTSAEIPASVELTFSGNGFQWIACKEPQGGIVSINLDGKHVGEVNLYSSDQLDNQVVYSLNGLSKGEHKLLLKYDRKGDSSQRYNGRINVDMIIIRKAGGESENIGASDPRIVYLPLKFRHTYHTKGTGRGVEQVFRELTADGCFLILAHPNSRLETKGEFQGMQLWSSSGYTFDELDSIFGNPAKGIKPLLFLPHALEIGNRGYDFSDRTAYRNAEEKWDYVLSKGQRVLGVATDDTHGKVVPEGWIVVNTMAPSRNELTIPDVMESLFSGNYYSSQGPAMNIGVDDSTFTIRTGHPSLIEFISRGKVIHHDSDVTSATYIFRGDEGYVRARVTREDGKWKHVDGGIGRKRSAWTNPVYIIREK